MQVIKGSGCWLGKLDPTRPDEAEAISILGTDLVPLPFTERADQEYIRTHYHGTFKLTF